ncbi:MAG: dihydroneopterin aldolase [Acidimicrobiales bacterium]
MTDRIELRGLRLMARCGALPEERERAQPFELDIDIYADLAGPGASDDLADTIDYGTVTAAVADAIESEQFTLLERLAQRVSEIVLADPRASAVEVTAHKLRPPVPHHLDRSGVRIRRERPQP